MVLRGQIVNGLFHGKGAFEYFNGMAQLFNLVNSLANKITGDPFQLVGGGGVLHSEIGILIYKNFVLSTELIM